LIAQGADIAVVTPTRFGLVLAPGIRVAGVFGTGIAVTAIRYSGTWRTVSVLALVALGAPVSVITRKVVGFVEAAGRRIAPVVGAQIGVVTIHRRGPRLALSFGTEIA